MGVRTFFAALAVAAGTASAAIAHVYNGVGYPAYNFFDSPIAYDTQASLGFTFTVSRPIAVGALGYWDQNGDGFATPHDVAIFLGDGAQGPGPVIASVVLPAGVSGVVDHVFGSQMGPSGFRYARIANVWLVPGQSYTIAGLSPDLSGNDPWIYGGPAETWGFDARQQLYGGPADVIIGPNAARLAYGTPTLMDPGGHVGDYQFYAVNFIVVPEPSAWLVMLAGIGGVGLALRAGRAAWARRIDHLKG